MKDEPEEGRAYGNLGNAYDSLGDLEKTLDCYERSLKIAKNVKDRSREARAHNCLGIVYKKTRRFRKSN